MRVKGKWGFIDTTGQFIVEPKYDGASGYNEGLVPVQYAGKWGYIDKQGKTVIPFQYAAAASFSEGFAAAQIDGKWGFLNKDGSIALKPAWEKNGEFSGGICPVEKNRLWGLIDPAGSVVLAPTYSELSSFTSGFAAARRGVVRPAAEKSTERNARSIEATLELQLNDCNHPVPMGRQKIRAVQMSAMVDCLALIPMAKMRPNLICQKPIGVDL